MQKTSYTTANVRVHHAHINTSPGPLGEADPADGQPKAIISFIHDRKPFPQDPATGRQTDMQTRQTLNQTNNKTHSTIPRLLPYAQTLPSINKRSNAFKSRTHRFHRGTLRPAQFPLPEKRTHDASLALDPSTLYPPTYFTLLSHQRRNPMHIAHPNPKPSHPSPIQQPFLIPAPTASASETARERASKVPKNSSGIYSLETSGIWRNDGGGKKKDSEKKKTRMEMRGYQNGCGTPGK